MWWGQYVRKRVPSTASSNLLTAGEPGTSVVFLAVSWTRFYWWSTGDAFVGSSVVFMNNVITPDMASLFNPPSTKYTLLDQHFWRSINLLKMGKKKRCELDMLHRKDQHNKTWAGLSVALLGLYMLPSIVFATVPSLLIWSTGTYCSSCHCTSLLERLNQPCHPPALGNKPPPTFTSALTYRRTKR